MKFIEIKEKEPKELIDLLKKKKVELFALKIKHKTMQLKDTTELRVAKKDIARINMAIGINSNREISKED